MAYHDLTGIENMVNITQDYFSDTLWTLFYWSHHRLWHPKWLTTGLATSECEIKNCDHVMLNSDHVISLTFDQIMKKGANCKRMLVDLGNW